jgi:hypothetical protein
MAVAEFETGAEIVAAPQDAARAFDDLAHRADAFLRHRDVATRFRQRADEAQPFAPVVVAVRVEMSADEHAPAAQQRAGEQQRHQHDAAEQRESELDIGPPAVLAQQQPADETQHHQVGADRGE